MKVLVIPDIHLKPWIFTRGTEIMKEGLADTAVCLMDIPDDWNKQFLIEEYAKTYDAAIEFAREYPNALWCWGNHDLCYMWNERESGFSFLAKDIVQKKVIELNRTLPKDNPIRYVQKIDDVLFSHGGISRYFVEKHIPISRHDDVSYVVDKINLLGHYDMWSDDSPIWYRPQDYKGKMYKPRKCLQVVGHTPIEKIEKVGNIISCDTFSTYRNGDPVGPQQFVLVDTVTWEFRGVK